MAELRMTEFRMAKFKTRSLLSIGLHLPNLERPTPLLVDILFTAEFSMANFRMAEFWNVKSE